MVPALLAASLLTGIAVAALGWVPQGGPWPTIAILASGVVAAATWRERPLAWLLASMLGLLSIGSMGAPATTAPRYGGLRPGLARLALLIARSGCGERGCFSEGTLVGCEEVEAGSCVPSGALLGIGSARELPVGGEVRALGVLRPRVRFENLDDALAWPDVRPALTATLAAGSAPRVVQLGVLDRTIFAARDAARTLLDASLAHPHAGIARALLLGDGAAIEPALNDAIRAAGVSHVIAVSGMHVTLLVGVLVALVRALLLRTPLAAAVEVRRLAAGLGVLLAPLVARLCGGSPSAVRAAYTSTLVYLVVALGLRPCALSISALVVLAHALGSSRDALHPGFVLSVLATAALLTGASAGRGVRQAARESLRAWLATAPFLVLCFGQTSLVALLANVALLPLGTALVPLAAVHLVAAALGLAGLGTSAVFALASGAFLEASRVCAALDPGVAPPPLSAGQGVALWLAAGACLLPLSRRARLATCTLAALLGLFAELALRGSLGREQVRVTFVDVGQGDATLIETGAGEHALIDAGGSIGRGPDPGAQAVLPLLRARRIERIRLVVLSHPHPDHYGGLSAVLDALPVAELWDTGQAEAEDAEGPVAALLAHARRRGVRVRHAPELCAATERLGPLALEVLSPCPGFDMTRGPNDNSFVIRAVHGQVRFLFTGDVEREGEAELAARGERLRSDVLKVAHHGSRTSSSERLLTLVRPAVAVISAGRANRFGHPHPEVVARLARASGRVLRTDENGGVELISDGAALRLRSASAREPVALPLSSARSLPEAREDESHAGDRAQQQDDRGGP